MPSTQQDHRNLYREALSTAQRVISAEIAQARAVIQHSTETGGLVERVIRSHLLRLLPEKVGVSNGFVMDSSGGRSKQMDIILYDRLNTPRIFASDGAQVFPVEATYACGEIKTKMDSEKFRDSFKKCMSYKRLKRNAYYYPSQKCYKLFGKYYDRWQSIFFCIAMDSVCASRLQRIYKEIVERDRLEINERVDAFVTFQSDDEKKNMLINAKVNSDGIPLAGPSVNFLPCHDNAFCTYYANEPWAFFVMLLLGHMIHAPTEFIKMIDYDNGKPY